MAFVFYDTETTGTNTSFDQILQFAAILTDDEFNELDRFEIRCRLLPHIVPAPAALRANRLRPTQLTDPSLPSYYAAICAIAEKLRAWSPAVFIGYNSLGFDEILLRQAFFQNLKPVYLTNTNRNTRADTYRLVQAANIYAPGSIVVPLTEDGRLTRRLEAIAPANGFNEHNAHDALGDVEATIYMARLVKLRAPEIWNAVMPLAAKPAVIQRVLSGQILSLTEFYNSKPCSWLVIGCGQNPEYNAQLAVFDLKYDPDEYLDLPVEALVEVMNSREKAIRCIRANNQPILMPLALTGPELYNLSITDDEIGRRAKVIAQASEFHVRVGEAIANRYPEKEPSPYVEQQIYDGFPTRTDEFLIEQFHRVPWEGRVKLVEQLQDQRLRELGHRLIFLERPDALSAQKRQEMELWQHTRLKAWADVPWLTVADALADAEALRNENPSEQEMLSELVDWFRGLASTTTRADESIQVVAV